MTFKHTNFQDSPTMRSLEKLAKEKGLVKNDPLKKIAERKPKTDLKPTSNLTENIMKLCAGLRESGFDAYADELESTFMIYKKASTECDSDILQQAHPKGSHKLEGVEGDATIETLLDQHLANMKMVQKKPTGKLSTAEEIISIVHKALIKKAYPTFPQNLDNSSEAEIMPWRSIRANHALHQIQGQIDQAKTIVDKLLKETITAASTFITNYNEISSELSVITPDNINTENIGEVLGDLRDIRNTINLINWKDWGLINPFVTAPFSAMRHIPDAIDIVRGNYGMEARGKVEGYINTAIDMAKRSINILAGREDVQVKADIKAAKEWNDYISLPSAQDISGLANSILGKINDVIRVANLIKPKFNNDAENTEYIDNVVKYLNGKKPPFEQILVNVQNFITALGVEDKKRNPRYSPDEFVKFVANTIFASVGSFAVLQQESNKIAQKVVEYEGYLKSLNQ